MANEPAVLATVKPENLFKTYKYFTKDEVIAFFNAMTLNNRVVHFLKKDNNMKKIIQLGSPIVVASSEQNTANIALEDEQVLRQDHKSMNEIHTPAEAEKIAIAKLISQGQEGLFLSTVSYKNGKIGKGTTSSWKNTDVNNIMHPMGLKTGWGTKTQNVIEFGAGDSFYVVYNKDDNDGYAPKDFIQNVWFNDTSIMNGGAFDDINKAFGLKLKKSSWGHTPQIRFKPNASNIDKGFLNTWIGSQSNHQGSIGFDSALDAIHDKVATHKITQTTFDAIANYYGVNNTKDQSGHYPNNPKVQGASKVFLPVFQGGDYFSYKKINDQVFKITFDNPNNINVTAAIWNFESTKDKSNIAYGPFSLGDKVEWDTYEKSSSPKYIFQARKNIFLNK